MLNNSELFEFSSQVENQHYIFTKVTLKIFYLIAKAGSTVHSQYPQLIVYINFFMNTVVSFIYVQSFNCSVRKCPSLSKMANYDY